MTVSLTTVWCAHAAFLFFMFFFKQWDALDINMIWLSNFWVYFWSVKFKWNVFNSMFANTLIWYNTKFFLIKPIYMEWKALIKSTYRNNNLNIRVPSRSSFIKAIKDIRLKLNSIDRHEHSIFFPFPFHILIYSHT